MTTSWQPHGNAAIHLPQPANNFLLLDCCCLISSTSSQPRNKTTISLPHPANHLMIMLLPVHHNECTVIWKCCYLFTTTLWQSCHLLPQQADSLVTRLLTVYYNQLTTSWQDCYQYKQQTTSWQWCFLLTSTSGQFHNNVATSSPQLVYNLMTMPQPPHHILGLFYLSFCHLQHGSVAHFYVNKNWLE